MKAFLGYAYFLCMCLGVSGHGMLLEPPQRSSMWRKGFRTPTNFDDNSLNCGGRDNQWATNQGRCGSCGDPYQNNPRDNEPGGKYYTDTIGGVYREGDSINIDVLLTANHRGRFEIRLCDNGALSGDALQACFGANVLTLDLGGLGGTAMNYTVQEELGLISVKALLPGGVTCHYCVLQWKYITGNTWGRDERGVGLGHGPQEQFINCANIKIESRPTGSTRTTSSSSTTTQNPVGCRAVGPFAANPGMHEWCVLHCGVGHCPASTCVCTS